MLVGLQLASHSVSTYPTSTSHKPISPLVKHSPGLISLPCLCLDVLVFVLRSFVAFKVK